MPGRHLDVGDDERGLPRLNQAQQLLCVACLAGDLKASPAEQLNEPLAQERLVVGD
jgi:hypothetical protein